MSYCTNSAIVILIFTYLGNSVYSDYSLLSITLRVNSIWDIAYPAVHIIILQYP